MKYFGCIFAREGSKGLPGKNIKIFNGMPLIAWSIEQAKKVHKIEKIIVSTDSEKIAEVAKSYGAIIPFIRPKKLATDKSPEWKSWKHLVNYLNDTNDLPDALVSLPACSPLRKPIDIKKCINKFGKNNLDAIVTVTKSKRSPYFNIVKKNKYGYCEVFDKNKKKIITNRQSAPQTYDLNTVCYVISTKFIIKKNNLFDGRVGFVETPEHRSIDIDTPYDFKLANFIYSTYV